MTSRERVLAALACQGFDRIPIKHVGTPEVDALLYQHFGVAHYSDLLTAVGDDFRAVGPAYIGPELRTFADGSWEGQNGERYANVSFGEGTYPESVYQPFADIEDVAQLDGMRFPSADQYDYSGVEVQCDAVADYARITGGAGIPDFINGIARIRGVEQVLLDIATEDPVYLELMARRFAFFYEMTERTLQAANGKIEIVHTGEDLGCQGGIIMSPEKFDRLFAPYFSQYFTMVHRYGAKVMMHSCGSVRALIPRLIDLGLDILDVVQVAAVGMDICELHREYHRHLAFCGSMCVQSVLPFGTPDDVRREVALRLELFADGGLILGPTHCIQVGTPLENILAMYDAAGSLASSAHA